MNRNQIASDLRTQALQLTGRDRDLHNMIADRVEAGCYVPADLQAQYVKFLNKQQRQTKYGK